MHVNLISQNTKQYINRHNANVERMSEAFKRELVQRITRNLLDIQILRLIQTQPMWGYRIKKQTEAKFGVKLRHGVLYPLLNTLERENFLTSQKQRQGGRTRKVYSLTSKGKQYLEAYNNILKEQLQRKDLK
jgi:DNA-binding PadR family transcriptional regulator